MRKDRSESSSGSAGQLAPSASLPAGVERGLTVPRNHSWALSVDTPIDACPTNLDLSDPRQRALAVAATQVPDYQLDQHGRCIVRATHYLAYADERPNEETGEIEVVRCAVLIDRDGKIYRSTSIFAFRALRVAAVAYSPEEWARGIPFLIQARLTSNRRIAHDVRVVIDMEDYVGPESEPVQS